MAVVPGTRAPAGFRRVVATPEEIETWKAGHNGHHPPVARVECTSCNKRIWGSGLGIGAHRRGCKGGK